MPKEPGAIEFWNIYVFVGLTVFAYILSLFSESMASHIHLVDDEADDEDEMFGWEQYEDDPNAPWSNWGGMLGLEGQKWVQQHQQSGLDQNGTEGDNMELVPGQEKNQPRPLDSATFQEPNDSACRNTLTSDQQWQQQQQLQLQQHQQMMMNRAKRRSSSGRVLLIPAKERKHMLEAEYYATHGGMMAQAHGHTDLADINAHYDTMYASDTSANGSSSRDIPNENASTHSRTSMISVPTTIRFVDSRGVPHHRRRMSLVPASGFGGIVGASSGFANAPGEIVGHFDTYGEGITFGTPAYYSSLSKRRQQRPSDRTLGRSVSAGGFERRGSILQRSGSNATDRIFNQNPEQTSTGSRVTSPTRQHVRFESPPMGSPKSLVAQRILLQDQHERDRQEWRVQKEMEETAKANASSIASTSLASGLEISHVFDWDLHLNPLAETSTSTEDIPMDSTKLPWPSDGNDDEFWMPSELKYPRESRSSDATKVASPEMTNVQWASMSSEEPSSLSLAANLSQPIPSALLSPRSIAATSGPVSAVDSKGSVGPLGEVRTEDTILNFEKEVDLNQVKDPPLSPPKGHKMPKKKKLPLSSLVQVLDRKGSGRSSTQSQESSDGEPSSSTLPSKLNVRKDIGPLNETRDTETILQFENNVDLNSDIEAPKAESTPEHLRKKSRNKGKKDTLKKSVQPIDNPLGGVQDAKAPPGKPGGLAGGPPPPISLVTQPAPWSAPILRQPPLSRPSRQPPLLPPDSRSNTLQQMRSPVLPSHVSKKGSYFGTSLQQPHDGGPHPSSIPLTPMPPMRQLNTNNPNDKMSANINTSSISMATTVTGGGANVFSPASSRNSSIATTISLGPFDELRGSASISRFDVNVDLNRVGSSHETHRQEQERRLDMERRQRKAEEDIQDRKHNKTER